MGSTSAIGARVAAEGEKRRTEARDTQRFPIPSLHDPDIPGGIPVTVRRRECETSTANDDDDGDDGSQSSYSEFADEEEEEDEEEQYSELEDDDKVIRHSIFQLQH